MWTKTKKLSAYALPIPTCPPRLQFCFPFEALTAHWGNGNIWRKMLKIAEMWSDLAVFIELRWPCSDCFLPFIEGGRSAVVMDRKRPGLHIIGIWWWTESRKVWKSTGRMCDDVTQDISWNINRRASVEQTPGLEMDCWLVFQHLLAAPIYFSCLLKNLRIKRTKWKANAQFKTNYEWIHTFLCLVIAG